MTMTSMSDGVGKQSEFYIEKRVKENEFKGQYHEMGAQ